MPLYAAEPGRHPQSVPFPYLCRVVDATGADVPNCAAVDTDRGWVVVPATDRSGNWIPDPTTGGLIESREVRPAPLRLVPLGPPLLYSGILATYQHVAPARTLTPDEVAALHAAWGDLNATGFESVIVPMPEPEPDADEPHIVGGS